MPGYRGHLAGGAVVFGIMCILLRNNCSSFITAAQWLGCALAGSLFPDIDIKSKGQKYFYWLILFGLAYLIFLERRRFEWLAALSVVSVIPMLVRHRGLFHRLWFVILFPLSVWLGISIYFPAFSQPVLFNILFFIAGAISHLWLDMGLRRMMRM